MERWNKLGGNRWMTRVDAQNGKNGTDVLGWKVKLKRMSMSMRGRKKKRS